MQKLRRSFPLVCGFVLAMAKRIKHPWKPWLWILGILGVLGFAKLGFVVPKLSPANHLTRISRTAVGLSSFTTGVTLLEKIDRERSMGPLEELGCEVRRQEASFVGSQLVGAQC